MRIVLAIFEDVLARRVVSCRKFSGAHSVNLSGGASTYVSLPAGSHTWLKGRMRSESGFDSITRNGDVVLGSWSMC